MKHAPADRARRDNMRQAALSCAESGEGFYFIGFNWEPHVGIRHMEGADSFLNSTYPLCFRAIVRVSALPKGGYDTAIVEVGGDDRVYGFTVNRDNKNSGRWGEPSEAQTLEVLYLRRV